MRKNFLNLVRIITMILLVIGCHNKAIGADQTKSISPITGVYGGLHQSLIENCVNASVDILYPSITWYAPNMEPKPLVDYAHKLGLKVIPSVAAAYDGSGENVSEFAKTHPHYWEKMNDGKLLNSGVYVNLSWAH